MQTRYGKRGSGPMLATRSRGEMGKRSTKQRSDDLMDGVPEFASVGGMVVQEGLASELDEDEVFDKENAAGMVLRSRSTRTTKPRRWTADELGGELQAEDVEDTDEHGNDSGRKPVKQQRKPGMNNKEPAVPKRPTRANSQVGMGTRSKRGRDEQDDYVDEPPAKAQRNAEKSSSHDIEPDEEEAVASLMGLAGLAAELMAKPEPKPEPKVEAKPEPRPQQQPPKEFQQKPPFQSAHPVHPHQQHQHQQQNAHQHAHQHAHQYNSQYVQVPVKHEAKEEETETFHPSINLEAPRFLAPEMVMNQPAINPSIIFNGKARPFKRCSAHVAAAYYIFYYQRLQNAQSALSNKDPQIRQMVTTLSLDPTYEARSLKNKGRSAKQQQQGQLVPPGNPQVAQLSTGGARGVVSAGGSTNGSNGAGYGVKYEHPSYAPPYHPGNAYHHHHHHHHQHHQYYQYQAQQRSHWPMGTPGAPPVSMNGITRLPPELPPGTSVPSVGSGGRGLPTTRSVVPSSPSPSTPHSFGIAGGSTSPGDKSAGNTPSVPPIPPMTKGITGTSSYNLTGSPPAKLPISQTPSTSLPITPSTTPLVSSTKGKLDGLLGSNDTTHEKRTGPLFPKSLATDEAFEYASSSTGSSATSASSSLNGFVFNFGNPPNLGGGNGSNSGSNSGGGGVGKGDAPSTFSLHDLVGPPPNSTSSATKSRPNDALSPLRMSRVSDSASASGNSSGNNSSSNGEGGSEGGGNAAGGEERRSTSPVSKSDGNSDKPPTPTSALSSSTLSSTLSSELTKPFSELIDKNRLKNAFPEFYEKHTGNKSPPPQQQQPQQQPAQPHVPRNLFAPRSDDVITSGNQEASPTSSTPSSTTPSSAPTSSPSSSSHVLKNFGSTHFSNADVEMKEETDGEKPGEEEAGEQGEKEEKEGGEVTEGGEAKVEEQDKEETKE